VFLISVFDSATAARCPNPLLPVSEGVQWHPSTGHTARQTTPSETSASFGSGSFGGWTATDTAITLSQRDHKGSMTMVVGPLAARDYKGVGNQYVDEGKVIVEPFVKSKRPQTSTDDETWVANQPNPTLNAFDQGDTRATTVIVQDPVLLTMREGKPGGGKGPLLSTDKSLSLSTSNEQLLFTPTAIPIQDGRDIDKHQNGLGVSDEGAPSYTIDQTGAQAVAYGLQGNMIGRQDHNGPQGAGISHPDDPMFSLTSTDRHAVATTMAVRRLTPLECERLMGWPDGWTATKADGTPQSDTHRYKQCGNGIASPVAQWIAQQLLKLTKDTHEKPQITT
jgi:hypothetical protein